MPDTPYHQDAHIVDRVYRKYIVKTDIAPDLGVRTVYTFPNGWSASVLTGPRSYGTELCVLDRFLRPNYKTGVTGDVLPYLDGPELRDALKAVSELWPDVG